MSRAEREKIIRVIIETLRPTGVTWIALFGSFARNEPGSAPRDIDILVRLPKPARGSRVGLSWFILDQELSKKLGLPVDLVTEDSVPKALRPVIERDLEVIYDEAG